MSILLISLMIDSYRWLLIKHDYQGNFTKKKIKIKFLLTNKALVKDLFFKKAIAKELINKNAF